MLADSLTCPVLSQLHVVRRLRAGLVHACLLLLLLLLLLLRQVRHELLLLLLRQHVGRQQARA